MSKGPHSLSQTDLCPSVLFPPTCSRRTTPGRKMRVQWWARAGQGEEVGAGQRARLESWAQGPPDAGTTCLGLPTGLTGDSLVPRAAQSRWPEAWVPVGRACPRHPSLRSSCTGRAGGCPFLALVSAKVVFLAPSSLGVCHAHLFPQRATSTGSWEGGVRTQPLPALPLTLPLLGCCPHPVPPPRPSLWLPDTPTEGTAPQLGTSPRPSRAGSSSHPQASLAGVPPTRPALAPHCLRDPTKLLLLGETVGNSGSQIAEGRMDVCHPQVGHVAVGGSLGFLRGRPGPVCAGMEQGPTRRGEGVCAWRVCLWSTAASWPVSREAPRVLHRHTARPQSRAAGLANVPPQLELHWLRLWTPCCPRGAGPRGLLSASMKRARVQVSTPLQPEDHRGGGSQLTSPSPRGGASRRFQVPLPPTDPAPTLISAV